VSTRTKNKFIFGNDILNKVMISVLYFFFVDGK
jgi:hypothetical protein